MKILFSGLLLALVIGACAPKEEIVLRSINMREMGMGLDGNPLLKADVIFYNPNATRMKLKKIDVDVFVDGKKAARVDQHLNQLIKGKSEFTIPVEVQLNFKEVGLLDTLLGMLGGKKHEVQFTGKIKVTVHGFPIHVPISYKDELRF